MPSAPEELVTTAWPVAYESHYLKLNSPDGTLGLWLKHTLFRPRTGEPTGELWAILSTRGGPPRVVRADVPWHHLELGPGLRLDAGAARLEPHRARGSIGGLAWELTMEGRRRAIHHLPWACLYRSPFPKKKILTPAPLLHFSGTILVDGRSMEVNGWRGLRGHNWGTEHAWSYAYGNCNSWDDGVDRMIDGFTARILLGSRPSPGLTAVTFRGPEGNRDLNRPWRWLQHGTFSPTSWHAWGRDLELHMECRPEDMVGLRYNQPSGGEGYCYNTKFASVILRLGPVTRASRIGELETFFPEPIPDLPIHPPARWSMADGVYDSARL